MLQKMEPILGYGTGGLLGGVDWSVIMEQEKGDVSCFSLSWYSRDRITSIQIKNNGQSNLESKTDKPEN